MASAWRSSPRLPGTSKPTLVLDMDGTLLYREEYVAVHKRPGVDKFLETMSKLYELVLWTNACEEDANEALEHLECKGRSFTHLLSNLDFSDDLTKDLVELGRGLDKVVQVDDDREIIGRAAMGNSIIVKYYAGGTRDRVLTDLTPVLEELVKAEDFRAELARLKASGALSGIVEEDDDENNSSKQECDNKTDTKHESQESNQEPGVKRRKTTETD